MIALALACKPELIIGDEPTTALDVMMQAQILELLEELRRELGLAMILITHDLSVLAETCDRVAIMYAGQIAELGPVARPVTPARSTRTRSGCWRRSRPSAARASWRRRSPACRPTRPTLPPGCRFAAALPPGAPSAARVEEPRAAGARPTSGLRAAADYAPWPAGGTSMSAVTAAAVDATPLFEARDLEVHFPIRRSGGRVVRAHRRRRPASGAAARCWASSASPAAASRRSGARCSGLQPPTRGRDPVRRRSRSAAPTCAPLRRRVQMVFQDPYQSLNPRQTVGSLVHGAARHPRHRRAASEQLRARAWRRSRTPGCAPAERFWDRYPHELSGGQRQRVVIAAAMALEPEALICDEPVSALDVSVRAQVLQVLMGLKRDAQPRADLHHPRPRPGVGAVRPVAVMYLGRIVESGHGRAGDRRPAAPVHAVAALGRADAVSRARTRRADPRRRAARRRATCRPAAGSTRAARRRSTAARPTTRAS